MFRAGQLHYTQTVPLDKVPDYRVMPDSPYVNAPYLGTYYYLFNTSAPPLDDVRVRRALALAVDREQLLRTVLHGVYQPAWSITPPDTLGYHPPKLLSHDPQRARALLAAAGYPGGAGWPGLELTYNTSEGHRKIAVALQQMWRAELGIHVTLNNQEWKVYLDTVDTMNFQMARRGWIGDYVDPNNFLDLFLCDGGNNNTGFCDARYDDMILRQAPRAPDRDARYALFHAAETRLMGQVPILPIVIRGTSHALPKRGFVLQGRHPISITVLEEIPFDGFRDLSVAELTARTREIFVAQLGEDAVEPVADPPPAVPAG